jgi:hypothetical protein
MPFIMPRSIRPSLALICPSFTDTFAGQPRRLPALERLVAYSDEPWRSSTTFELDAWQCELLTALDLKDASEYPSAPLTLLGAGCDPERGTWLHAEPVVQAISAYGLTMSLCGRQNAASMAEIELLLRDHLAAAQMSWHVVGGRSYLRINSTIDARTVSARQATVGELQDALPTGPDATILRRAMTELQMLLHEKLNHPLAPNAVWLWGGGQMPRLAPKELAPMWTNDDYARGLYRALAASSCCPLPPSIDVLLEQANSSRLLAVIRDCGVDELERSWFAPTVRALNAGWVRHVDVYLDGWQLHARRSVVRRLFAVPRPLTEWMH